MFKEKTVLITGGTGTIGSNAIKLFTEEQVKEIRIFSRDEDKQFEMQKRTADKKIKFIIGDVRDKDSLFQAMKGVDYVLHTAALKQVPSTESWPLEAVKTNIMGTDNVLSAAIACGVKKVICTSTDKAVYPISAMGLSKALMEKVIVSKALGQTHETCIACIRLGNVIGSRGSVIPTFIDQAMSGHPLTVTNTKMTRFIMHIEEVLMLIMHAFQKAQAGDIIIKKMDLCSIYDLAKTIGKLFGSGNECDIHITGDRTGDKIYEDLLTEEELAHTIDTGEYYHFNATNEGQNNIDPKSINSGSARPLSMEQLQNILLHTGYIQNKLRETSLK